MPAISPKSRVLVTGANDSENLALWTVKTLLERGYSVRVAVSDRQDKRLKIPLLLCDDRLQIVYVQDITKDGAFDEAVMGVDGILHIACPRDFLANEISQYVDPTINATTSIMKSAEKANIKRIVFTSSSVAISFQSYADREFDESDWNEAAITEVRGNSNVISSPYKYAAAKVIGEKTVLEYYERNKEYLKWDIVSLLPADIYGPVLQNLDSPSQMEYCMSEWYHTMFENKHPYLQGHIWVDVRDAALAHVLALEKEEACGQRILISSGAVARVFELE